MKTQEEIGELAKGNDRRGYERNCFIDGYTQCQEDMAKDVEYWQGEFDHWHQQAIEMALKKYTEEDIVKAIDDLPLESKERIIEQALVLRWFRKEHDLKSWVQEHTSDDFIYEIRPHVLSDYKDGEQYVYKTHEEAESACLDKLIEICKNNYCHYSGLPSTSSYDQ